MNERRRLDVGAIFIGAVILVVGVYYLLRNTLGFDIPELSWDQLWPLLVIGVGVAILWSNWQRQGHGPQGS